MGSQRLLDLESVHVSFGDYEVLRGLNLSLSTGEAKFLVGPNGCGKTTLFNVIAGTVKLSEGEIYLSGERASHLSPQKRAWSGIIRSFQVPRLSGALTALDHILAAQRRLEPIWFKGLLKQATEAQLEASATILREFGFDGAGRKSVSGMSHGQRKLLDVACCFAANPHILLLDEPTAGIGKDDKALLAQVIIKRASVLTMMMIEHDIDFVERFDFPIAFLSKGRILHEGSLTEIKSLPEASHVYF